MELEIRERSDDLTEVALVGKLDIQGLHAVDLEFHGATAAAKKDTLVDLSGLDFVASLGLGMLISCAQSLQREGRTMVLVGARGDVQTALETAGIDQAIPMVADNDAALTVLAG